MGGGGFNVSRRSIPFPWRGTGSRHKGSFVGAWGGNMRIVFATTLGRRLAVSLVLVSVCRSVEAQPVLENKATVAGAGTVEPTAASNTPPLGNALGQDGQADGGSPVPSIGSYVRGLAGSRFEGKVLEISTSAFALDTTDGKRKIRRDLVTKLEVKSGSRRQTKLGLLIGTTLGVLAGSALDSVYASEGGGSQGALYFGAIGAGAGALLGSVVKRSEWTVVVAPSRN